MSEEPSKTEFRNDHDALITLISEFRSFSKYITDEIRDLKDNTANRLNKLEERVDTLETKDAAQDRKISNQKVAIAIYVGGVAIMVGLILTHIFTN